MALANYTDLVAAVQNWLDWTDAQSTARIPECVSLFEAYANRRLRIRPMIATATLTPSGAPASASLPADFLAVKNVTRNADPRDSLEEMEDWIFIENFGSLTSTGPSRVYCIRGANMLVGPTDTTPVTLIYYQAVPGLQTNSTNWLMTSHPDLYLFGVLVEANAFRTNATAAQLWKARRDEIMQELTDYSYRGPAPTMRIASVNTP